MLLSANDSPVPKKLPRVVTSFNEEGYKRYGKKFIETWLKHWPASIGLTVYYEGDDFDLDPKISWRPIEEVEFLADYLEALKFPIMHGIVGDRYDINFDARHGRKTFIENHAIRQYGGKVFWMDSDSVTYQDVPEGFLDQCLPDDKFSSYLGRDGWYFTESGFIGFNANHQLCKEFFRNYVHMFITGVIFAQAPQYDNGQYLGGGWHDCIGYDCTRFIAKQHGHESEFVNMSAHVPRGTMHPHANSAIGKYMKHLKGNRKESGELKEGDVIVSH